MNQDQIVALEKRYANESKLMLSAWHDLGSRTTKDHLVHSLNRSKRSGAAKPVPQGWLGRQRRYQEDAVYVRLPRQVGIGTDVSGSLFLIHMTRCSLECIDGV